MRQDPAPAPPFPPDVRRGQEERLLKAWKPPRGWRYFSEVNNTRVGPWYIGAAGAFGIMRYVADAYPSDRPFWTTSVANVSLAGGFYTPVRDEFLYYLAVRTTTDP